MRTLLLFALLCPAVPASAQNRDFSLNALDSRYVAAQDNTRVVLPPAPVFTPGKGKGGAKPKDDLKAKVKSHLDSYIAYCDGHQDDCSGTSDWLRDFAATIGNGRCHNRGYDCVRGVLEGCRADLDESEITPMYYMACAAMLGKLGERDCGGGRKTCAGDLQGALYFSLRASAACYKSFEEEPAEQKRAKVQMDKFAKAVNQSVKGVYVKDVAPAHSTSHILIWEGAAEARNVAVEKVLEFAFEKLAWHGAEAAVGAVGVPLMAFSGFMLFHEIAAAEMHKEVCLNWGSYYNGNYANVAGSVQKMTAKVK